MSDISLETYRRRYAQAGRKWKTYLLNEVCETEGCTRKHAIKSICQRASMKAPSRRGRPRKYGPDVSLMLEKRKWTRSPMEGTRLKAPIFGR